MRILSIVNQGAKLHATSDSLVLNKGKEEIQRFRPDEFNQIFLFGRVECTSFALALLARRKIDVVFLTKMGNFRFRLSSRQGAHASLKVAQAHTASLTPNALPIAISMVAGKIANQHRLLLRKQRKLRDESIAGALCRLRMILEQLPSQTTMDSLNGMEGLAASIYFSHFNKLVSNPELPFHGRSRRPPLDPINACLSFGYTMLQNIVESELLSRGFDPSIGLLHQPHAGRSSLALDMMEEFRPLVDSLVLRLVNRSQLTPLDFEYHSGDSLDEILSNEYDMESTQANTVTGCFLGHTGRKVFLAEFFSRMREKIIYGPRQISLDLRSIIREQVFHLARVLEQKDLSYEPFAM